MSKKMLIFAFEKETPKMSPCFCNMLQASVVGYKMDNNLLIIKKLNTMKKALLFLGLAMCTGFAFAQTNNYAKPQQAKCNENVLKIDLKALALENADYKASIFTKAAGDTLGEFNFENAAAMAGILYGDNGLVASSDVVNGQPLSPNGNTNACARWQWIPDTNYLESSSFAAAYAWLGSGGGWHSVCRYFKSYLADDGGFMLMTLIDLQAGGVPPAGSAERTMLLPHAYFQLPTVTNPDLDENKVIDVTFTQIYRNFYDQTFIDYQIGNNWKTREINVDGVDVEINDYASPYVRYVMPIELGSQSNINIRFRYLGGVRSNAYGYFWGVDNVLITSGGKNRLLADAQDWAGGAYGTVPQGMEFPLSWWANSYNGGYYPISNLQLHAYDVAADGTGTEFATNSFPTMPAGDPTAATPIYFNEQGLLYTDSLKEDFYYFYYMPGAYSGGHYMDSVMDPTLGYAGMSTETVGRHRVAVTATADSNILVRWDTIAYRVVGNTSEDQQPVAGYRWGHDNGIIASGQSYHAGYVMDNGTRYISEDEGSWDQNGYGVYVRYTTGPTIPQDQNGQPWVLRGVEIVTSAEHSALELNEARLRPVTYVDAYEDNSFGFYDLDNGVNNVTFTINGSDVNNSQSTGVQEATADNYNAVNIFFPTQPELTPNTSYHIGYQLASSCTFSAAATATSYAAGPNSTGDGYVYYNYDSNSISAPWRHQFWANNADVIVKDPLYEYLSFHSSHYNFFPMIRAIVGPREILPDAQVQVYCENEYENYIMYNGETVCGELITVPETSGPTFTIVPADPYMILDSLFIDSVYVPLPGYDDEGDEDFVAHDYSIIDTVIENGHEVYYTNLERYYWTYTFRNIHGVHSIRAVSHNGEDEWVPTAVDPVAPEVRMYLAPNPATSQVALNIKGVSGMVNCNVIDMSGRVVYNREINAENANTIDLRNVPAGAYFVRITNDTFSKVEKLIVR